MSRGPGVTQRDVLTVLAHYRSWWTSISALAGALYGPEPTESQRRGLRRAVRGLRESGLVMTRRMTTSSFEPGAWCFTTDPPLTPDQVRQHSAWNADQRRWIDSDWPTTTSPAGRMLYHDNIPPEASEVDDPMSWGRAGYTVTWFRLPKLPPRWESWVTLASISVPLDSVRMPPA